MRKADWLRFVTVLGLLSISLVFIISGAFSIHPGLGKIIVGVIILTTTAVIISK